jgi:hypothetical protein
VDIELGRHSVVDFAQKRQEFLMPVARLACRQYGAVKDLTVATKDRPEIGPGWRAALVSHCKNCTDLRGA